MRKIGRKWLDQGIKSTTTQGGILVYFCKTYFVFFFNFSNVELAFLETVFFDMMPLVSSSTELT